MDEALAQAAENFTQLDYIQKVKALRDLKPARLQMFFVPRKYGALYV